MKTVNTQRAITPEVGKPDLWFMISAFNFCVKFHENMSSGFKLMKCTRKLLTHIGAITPKVGKPELRFMCSACRLMVFNICVKCHENISSSFKLMEQTQKLLPHKGK